MGPTEELEDIRASQSTPLENLSERLTFPEQEAHVIQLTTLYNVVENSSLLFCNFQHSLPLFDEFDADEVSIVCKWRQKERLKTTAVALVVCLNIGVDPPDVIKISPCARMECWVDPLSMQAPKALDTIGKNLQAQYERWQPRAKYRMHLDPTTEDVKKLVVSCRRTAKGERVLFHYNGHGVPRPTTNGEIWVFNKSYTQYIPLSIYDLQNWVGTPAIYIFDCSVAGQILLSFKQFMSQNSQDWNDANRSGCDKPLLDSMKDMILLCSCSESELLPQDPEFPADLFTSCLTTPIKIALHFFCSRSMLVNEGLTKELIDRIPGKQTDRKTPLGELNWIFTAITDTIAWNVLPRALFQKLFRQDLLVASLFRNFLLAQRIMQSAGCTPMSHPRLPAMHQHPMWLAWDTAAETCLLQLPGLVNGNGEKEYQPSPFFSDQLTAFELWLDHGCKEKSPPEQLPIVLQVLLSQVHRLRALVLLGRFLDMGSWAVDLALSVGIFPYVLKLLQTSASDLRQTLVFIWTKIIAWDMNSQVQTDLIKDGGYLYFIKQLESDDPDIGPESRAQAAFILAAICKNNPKGQLLCAQAGLVQICMDHLPAAVTALASAERSGSETRRKLGTLIKWLMICLGQLCEDIEEITAMAMEQQKQGMIASLLKNSDSSEIRAAACYAIGCLFNASKKQIVETGQEPDYMLHSETTMICSLLDSLYDASPLVRCELCRSLSRAVIGNKSEIQEAVRQFEPEFLFPTSISLHQDATAFQGTGLSPVHSAKGNVAEAGMNEPAKITEGAYEDVCRTDDSVVKLVAKAFLVLAWDPAKQVADRARQCLTLLGIDDSSTSAYQQNEQAIQSLPKSSSVSAMSSFLPKSWQAKSWRSFNQPSTRSLPNERSSDSIFYADEPSTSKSTTIDGSRQYMEDQLSSRRVFHEKSAKPPASVIYGLSCRQFRWPLLFPLAEEEPGVPWLKRCPEGKLRQRKEMRDAGIFKCQSNTFRVKLKDQVHAINTGANSINAILLEPFKPQIVTADTLGKIRVFDYIQCKKINEFHSGRTGSVKAPTKSLYRLNTLYNELLLTCAENGHVSAWRYYSKTGCSSPVTSWQSVLSSGIPEQPAIFALSRTHLGGALFAASSTLDKKSVINVWDLHREQCVSQLTTTPENVENFTYNHIYSSKFNSILYTAGSDGYLTLYDYRSNKIVSSSRYEDDIIGLAPEIEAEVYNLAIGHRSGKIDLIDFRKSSGSIKGATVKEIDGHSRGCMTVIQGHQAAPIFATATSSQVVKVWTSKGDQLGVVRPHTSILGQPIGPTKCLAFSPFSLKLASGGGDSICAVYSLEQIEQS